ncbi:MAG: hypothetical protein VB027_06370 [Gordonibacter sp.]|nr:hypothetical protein [Gordonibacter sp.]
MNETLFRRESIDRAKSSERTDAYLKVSNPSLWLLVAAVVILLASFAAWAFGGQIPIRYQAVGVVDNESITVFLPAEGAPDITTSMEVLLAGRTHRIVYVSDDVVSAEEIQSRYDEREYYQLKPASQNIVFIADAKGIADGVISVSVVVGKRCPFDYLFEQ